MTKSKLAVPMEEDLRDKTDEQLIAFAKNGEQDALDCIFKRYKELVNMKVSKYFIIGAEKEDIIQEGLIGLYKAVKNFDLEKQSSFKSFANLCIERQLITAIKTSNRQKHIPLNSSLSLNASIYDNDDDNNSLMEMLNTEAVEDPLDTLTKKEYYKAIGIKIDEALSGFEKQVLSKYVLGESYVSIAEKLDAPVKSIDNAIQRIRKKAVKSIMDEE